MTRWLYVSRTVDRPIDAVVEKVNRLGSEFLREPEDRTVEADGSFVTSLQVDGAPFVPPLRVSVGAEEVRLDGRHVIPLTWSAETLPELFPTFTGSIELEPLSTGIMRVSVVGSYAPPLGPVGNGIDALFLHTFADATGRAFLERAVRIVTTPALV